MIAIQSCVHALSVAVGESTLTAQVTNAAIAALPGLASIVADSTVAAAGVEIHTNTFAVGKSLLTGQQARALDAGLSLGASVVAGTTV